MAALLQMSEGTPPDPLARLGERLARAQEGRTGHSPSRQGGAPSQQGLALGLRIGLELVVAVIVGTGLGWAIDRVLGTRPWGTLVLFFLGVAAGMLNVYRAVTRIGGAVGLGTRATADHSAAAAPTPADEDEN